MISNRPYLLRAMFEWMVDNEWTPHLQLDATYPGIEVPMEFAEEGVLVLNIHPDAVMGLRIENDWISFKARFGGIERQLGFPPEAVLAIFAKETGHGMPFPAEPHPSDEALAKKAEAAESPKKSKKPHLSIVK